jgi:hypothetical protein
MSNLIRLRFRSVFDASERNSLENLVNENDWLDFISTFLILLFRDDETLLHVSLRIKLIEFLIVFSKLNDEIFERFTRNQEFAFFLFAFILRCFFFFTLYLSNQMMWSIILYAMHVWIFFESTCEQSSMLCFFAHCSHATKFRQYFTTWLYLWQLKHYVTTQFLTNRSHFLIS